MKDIFEFFDKALDFIYKKKCYCCGSSKECIKLCSKCYEKLSFRTIGLERAIDGVAIYSAGVYDRELQKLIRGIKYHKQRELGFYIAKFMWEYFSQVIEKDGLGYNFQVIPVPLHKKRQKKRGYNHMELITKEFCHLSGFELNTEAVVRIKNTKPQYKLSRNEKIENLKNAFSADKSKLSDVPVLIIDDICTSGSTFGSIIKTLRGCGVEKIICLSTSSPKY